MSFPWIVELMRDGLRNLLRYKLRTLLTLLGVTCGVAAVITMLAIGTGGQRTVLREISALGLRNIILDSVQPPASSVQSSSSGGRRMLLYGVTEKDVRQIRSLCPEATISVAHLVRKKVYAGSKRLDARILGVSSDYFNLFDTRVLRGRLITTVDNIGGRSVAVVSEAVANAMARAGRLSVGPLSIGNRSFDVVGTVETGVRSDPNLIFLPYRTARNGFGTQTMQMEQGGMEFTRNEIGQVVVRSSRESQVPRTAAIIQSVIESNHTQPDVVTFVPMDLLRSKQRTQRILNLVLISIAAISLVVGGIGIMNIMLAIVTERIPEIGLRRAVGARKSDIMLQFLAETVTLSTLGGLIGCLVGMLTVPIASTWTGWPGVITMRAVVLSLSVSWVVGLVFGITPAIRAARMDPVTALRHE
ncbi:MAG: ABC transporter permease [Lentisphaerae bacterium]|nr:ABC transporter permease [Lentisphaerota bacterium]